MAVIEHQYDRTSNAKNPYRSPTFNTSSKSAMLYWKPNVKIYADSVYKWQKFSIKVKMQLKQTSLFAW